MGWYAWGVGMGEESTLAVRASHLWLRASAAVIRFLGSTCAVGQVESNRDGDGELNV